MATEQNKIKPTKDDNIIRVLFNEKKQYEESTRSKRTEISTIFDAYNGKMTDRVYPWSSDKFIPIMRKAISYVLPFIFSGEPEIEVEPVGEEDRFLASVVEKMVNYRLQQSIPDSFEKILDWVSQSVTFGTSFIQTVWVFETRVQETKEVAEDGSYKVVKTKEVIRDEPDLIVPNLLDVYLNPLISDIKKQSSVIIRYTKSIQELKGDAKYKNTDKIKPKANFADDTYNSQSINDIDLDDTEKLQQEMNIVEVYERITPTTIQTVVDGAERIVIRDVKNTYNEINIDKLLHEKDPIPNRAYGKGVGQNTIDLQALSYDLFNQIMDNIKNVANKMYVGRRGAGINPNQLISKPGGMIEVNNITEDIRELPQADIKDSAFEVLARVDQELQGNAGVNDLIQGEATGDTLGQDQLRQSNSSVRFDLVRRRFKHALASVAGKIIRYDIDNLQDVNAPILRIFTPEERGEIFRLLTTEGKNMKFNVRVKGETILVQNKDVMVKQLNDLFSMFSSYLTPKEQRQFGRRILELKGQQGIDDLIAEEPEIPEGSHMMPDGTVMPNEEMGGYGMPQGAPTQTGINQAANQY